MRNDAVEGEVVLAFLFPGLRYFQAPIKIMSGAKVARGIGLAIVAALWAQPTLAQMAEPVPEPPPAETQPNQAAVVTTTEGIVDSSAKMVAVARLVPAGTLIGIRLEAVMSSQTARNDDLFPITLLTPIQLDGEVIVPVGTPGMGQVVHAAGRGFGGRAGELILAARYLQWGGRRIPLRGMRVSMTGRNNRAEAVGLSASVLSVAGLFVTGTSVDLQIGHEAIARLSEDLVLDPGIEAARVGETAPPTGESE